MNDIEYYIVPIYIEKAIKKLYKLKGQERELVMQVKDYMSTHGIPANTPLQLLKYEPKEEVNPDQMQLELDFNSGVLNEKEDI